ncbi:MAG: hypothetical protein ACE5KZ_00065 [Candidatus Scalinduaceae bacterium]
MRNNDKLTDEYLYDVSLLKKQFANKKTKLKKLPATLVQVQ